MRDESGPAGLMGGAQPGARVTVEVLVEQQQVAPFRVTSESFDCTRERPLAGRVREPDCCHPLGKSGRDVAQPELFAGSRWELDGERAPQAFVPPEQRFDEHVVQREPDRPAPIRVRHRRSRSSTRRAHSQTFPVYAHRRRYIRMLAVDSLLSPPDPYGLTGMLFRIEHSPEYPLHVIRPRSSAGSGRRHRPVDKRDRSRARRSMPSDPGGSPIPLATSFVRRSSRGQLQSRDSSTASKTGRRPTIE